MRTVLLSVFMLALAVAVAAQPAPAPPSGMPMQVMPAMMPMQAMPAMMPMMLPPLLATLTPASIVGTPDRIFIAKGDRLVAYDHNLRQLAETTLPPLELPALAPPPAALPAPGPAPGAPPAAPGMPPLPMAGMMQMGRALLQVGAPTTIAVHGDRLVVARGNQVFSYDQSLRLVNTANLPAPKLPDMAAISPMMGMGRGPMAPMAGRCPMCGGIMPGAARPADQGGQRPALARP